MNNEPCWIVWFEWEEWGETASKEVWISKIQFPDVQDAVTQAENDNFSWFDHAGVRRVEDGDTGEEVEF